MADEIIDQIDIAINAFTDDKTGCIRRFQRITDDASNKEHFNVNSAILFSVKQLTTSCQDTYEYFNDICSDLHSLQYPIEDLVDDSISDEDADRVVTKLEEVRAHRHSYVKAKANFHVLQLISAEKPLFDHYHACYNGSEVLVPWKNISPTAHEAPECYEPGYIDDLFEYHNSAWKVRRVDITISNGPI